MKAYQFQIVEEKKTRLYHFLLHTSPKCNVLCSVPVSVCETSEKSEIVIRVSLQVYQFFAILLKLAYNFQGVFMFA